MSTEQVSETAKKTLKTVRELLEKAEASTHKALEKAAPAVSKSIDSSIEAASKGFNSTMKTIDGATVGDQVKLLKAYRKFIGARPTTWTTESGPWKTRYSQGNPRRPESPVSRRNSLRTAGRTG